MSGLTKEKYDGYIKILKDELVPAMGCTEPIAIAYAAAVARETLGQLPESAEIEVSGSIIKNAKSVVVPHTGGMRGIEAALVAGLAAGRSEAHLEVLSEVKDSDIPKIRKLFEQIPITVSLAKSPAVFFIRVRLTSGDDTAEVKIEGRHTNIVEINKSGECIFKGSITEDKSSDRVELTVKDIVEFFSYGAVLVFCFFLFHLF